MNPTHLDPCLTLEQIEAHLRTGREDECFERHVDSCARCRRQVEDIRRNNALLSSVLDARRGEEIGASIFDDHPMGEALSITGYRVMGEIHRGAQGVVFKAYHEATKRTVAVKVILHGALATSKQRERFQREVELIAALDHPGIVTIYDSGVTNSMHSFYSMKLVDGVGLDVDSPRASGCPQPAGDALAGRLKLFHEICTAVNHAHQHGIIHRDLKPSNILVDNEGRPHVVDFGLAKVVAGNGGHGATREEGFMGTLEYASPEQAEGNQNLVDIRSDVYSLGVILYQMITGRFPYPVDGALSDVLRHISRTAPQRPTLGQGDPNRFDRLDDDLETILLTALAKERDRRYQSAGLLAADIDNYLCNKPIDAKKDSAWYVLTKLARRNKLRLGLAVVFLIATIVTAVTMTFLYRRSMVEAAKAQRIKVFLEDTLGSVDGAEGGPVLVRDVLDDASRWIEIALKDEPEVEASLRTTIGNAYRTLHAFAEAEEHLQIALQKRLAMFGKQHAQVASSLNALALLALDRGNLQEAEDLSIRALNMRSDLLGADHAAVATNLQNLGNILLCRGQPKEAFEVFGRALAIRRSQFGEVHPDVAMVLINLARASAAAGRADAAERLYGQAMSIRRETLKPKHPDLAAGLIELGDFLVGQGKESEAEPLLREGVALRAAAYSRHHWKTAAAESSLGGCLSLMGRYEEAEALLTKGFTLLADRRGRADRTTQSAAKRLVALYERWGKAKDAARWQETLSPTAGKENGF